MHLIRSLLAFTLFLFVGTAHATDSCSAFLGPNITDHAFFNKVPAGRFMMGEKPGQVLVTLTEMPEVMATPVTQIIYRLIAELANKRFPQKYNFNPDPSLYKGDQRPVESMSNEDAEKWVEALNDLFDAGEPELNNMIVGHKPGMRYGGYLTEAQREYLMKIAKTEDGDSIDEMIQRNDLAKLKKYAAFGDGKSRLYGEGQGHLAVTELLPLFIEGQPFWGLVGNVYEPVLDRWDRVSPLKGGVNPLNRTGDAKMLRGGCYYSQVECLHSTFRDGWRFYSPWDNYPAMGLRLVRTQKIR